MFFQPFATILATLNGFTGKAKKKPGVVCNKTFYIRNL